MISLYEIDYLYESEILNDYLENSKVKKLIDKSKKLIKELNKDNIKQFMDDNRGLFNDPKRWGFNIAIY